MYILPDILPDINIIRVKRKGLTDDKLGIVKMELPSEEAVDDVLKYKSKLNNMEDETISNIYIRQSQPDDTRTFQHNDRLLIKAIDPHGEKFKYLRSGRIVHIADHGGQGHDRGSYRGRGGPGRGRGGPGRGRGGPGRGRGGPRGRGSGHARRGQRNQTTADYSKWTRSDKKPGENVPHNPQPGNVTGGASGGAQHAQNQQSQRQGSAGISGGAQRGPHSTQGQPTQGMQGHPGGTQGNQGQPQMSRENIGSQSGGQHDTPPA